MKEEELQKTVDNSLWENLVQLTDNLDDYSVLSVINKNEKLIRIFYLLPQN